MIPFLLCRFEKLAKELQKASPLGIMDKALEKFGDYIAIAFRTSLEDDLYRILTIESTSAEEIFSSLNLTSENNALEVVNRIDGAILAWKEIISDQSFLT
ncbi:hypothetical protein BC332_25690 [Capsicum chinense]|nr:hypothetical protein BC332_25690 [Capsicum chinense]